jgi:enamine deaminase RidA (YjgF/YER057c/UK114 family)
VLTSGGVSRSVRVYRELMGRHFPTMTMVEVAALIEPEARVEVETTAVVPAEPR